MFNQRPSIYSILFLVLYLFSNHLVAEENLNLPPEPFKVKPIHLPSHQSFTLKNGLKVYLIEDHKLPSVSYFLYLDYLPKIEPRLAGLGEFTARLLKQGAGKRSKHEIDEELDFMGSDLSIEDNIIFANSLRQYAKETLEIVTEILRSPKFDETEFLKVKEEMISKIRSEKQNPDYIATNIAKSILYGENHPYGEIPTEKSVKNILIKDCINYHKLYFKPNITHLAIMGDIGLEEAKTQAETYLETWESGEIPKPKDQKFTKYKKGKIYLMNRPDSVQSVVKITHNVNLHPGDKDIYSAAVMNTLLGGGVFRLYRNLREKHGYTYGVYSTLRPDKYIGNFSVDFNTENSLTQKSIQEVFFEFNRIHKEKVDSEELQLVKNYLTGQYSLSLENPGTIALFAIKSSLYQLPADYYEKYLTEINKVSDIDVLNTARKYIPLGQSHIIIVGKKKELVKKLKTLKKYKIVDVDIYGKRK